MPCSYFHCRSKAWKLNLWRMERSTFVFYRVTTVILLTAEGIVRLGGRSLLCNFGSNDPRFELNYKHVQNTSTHHSIADTLRANDLTARAVWKLLLSIQAQIKATYDENKYTSRNVFPLSWSKMSFDRQLSLCLFFAFVLFLCAHFSEGMQ